MDDKIRRVRPVGANRDTRNTGQKRGEPSHNRKVDEDKLRELAADGMTNKEIADVLGVSASTLSIHWRHVLDEARGTLAQTLRQKQLKKAYDGDTQMLIWLGKQYLRQSDKVATVTKLSLEGLTDDELEHIISLDAESVEEDGEGGDG